MNERRQDHEAMFRAYDYEVLTFTNATAIGFTTSKYSDITKRVVITIENANIRYRYDGTNPTTSEGHLLYARDALVLNDFANIKQFRGIATGSDAKGRVTFER